MCAHIGRGIRCLFALEMACVIDHLEGRVGHFDSHALLQALRQCAQVVYALLESALVIVTSDHNAIGAHATLCVGPALGCLPVYRRIASRA